MEYDCKFSELTIHVHKWRANCNQVGHLLHITEREITMQILLQVLIHLTKELTALQEQTVSLIIYYRQNVE